MGLAWQAAARELFEDKGQVLLVSAKNPDLARTTQVEDLRAAEVIPRGPYAGIVWRVHSPLFAGLEILQPKLEPGGILLLVIETASLPEALLGSVLGKPPRPRYVLEDVCEALLLKGMGEPTLLASDKGSFAVSAKNPLDRSLLDAFFEQPLA